MQLLAETPFRGSLDFDEDGIDADFVVGYNVETDCLTFAIEEQAFDSMPKIARTRRTFQPVYRLERNITNERKKKSTEYEIAFCELREDDASATEEEKGASAAAAISGNDDGDDAS